MIHRNHVQMNYRLSHIKARSQPGVWLLAALFLLFPLSTQAEAWLLCFAEDPSPETTEQSEHCPPGSSHSDEPADHQTTTLEGAPHFAICVTVALSPSVISDAQSTVTRVDTHLFATRPLSALSPVTVRTESNIHVSRVHPGGPRSSHISKALSC